MEFQWVSMANNELDMFTKNLAGSEYNKQLLSCVGLTNTITTHKTQSHEQGRMSGLCRAHITQKHMKIRISAPGIN